MDRLAASTGVTFGATGTDHLHCIGNRSCKYSVHRTGTIVAPTSNPHTVLFHGTARHNGWHFYSVIHNRDSGV